MSIIFFLCRLIYVVYSYNFVSRFLWWIWYVFIRGKKIGLVLVVNIDFDLNVIKMIWKIFFNGYE